MVATWCPEQQIYVNGIASSSDAEEHIAKILDKNSSLCIFGYGSLCWHPGDGILSHPNVFQRFGLAKGYRRCWSQKSTDHRGDTSFPGLVCTLLKDEEYRNLAEEHGGSDVAGDTSVCSMTGGLLYTIPKELVGKCLEELDFREKGGYARDVIDVIVPGDGDGNGDENDNSSGASGNRFQALVYRGTPDNPAFSNRALFDELYAASVLSVAKGPSGNNDEYLYQLDDFLSKYSKQFDDAAKCIGGDDVKYVADRLTQRLAARSKNIQKKHDLYFLYGSGSNQHDQLLLNSSRGGRINSANLVSGDEAHDLKELVLVVPKKSEEIDADDDADVDASKRKPKRLYAGGGHSGLLTHNDDLYLWGWNDSQQLGREDREKTCTKEVLDFESHPIVLPLDIKVEDAAFGHSHTLVIEKGSQILYAFGDDNRGQVSGGVKKQTSAGSLVRHDLGKFVGVSTGLFHSAGITETGELITFGCGRFGQALPQMEAGTSIGRWMPPDGSRLVKVACGRRHTIALDEFGRVYSMGDNKYKQLGRVVEGGRDQKMELVDGILGEKGSGCFDIDCGWSHTIALLNDDTTRNGHYLYGWGRNDKMQLSTHDDEEQTVGIPRIIKHISGYTLKGACCGSESVSILDEQNELVSCGWNEHGNLGIGHSTDASDFTVVKGAIICNPAVKKDDAKLLMASGGAHFLVTSVKMDI